MPTDSHSKLGHPAFLTSVALLIVNDWFLKAHFHNALTGKLSDFAGLFAFPFLLSVLLPHRKMLIHILTAILFALWKSSLPDPVIDSINLMGIPAYRTKDMTDLVALISLPASYYSLASRRSVIGNSFVLRTVLIVSSISFIATSLPPAQNRKYTDINKAYYFDFSRRELVSRINRIQLKEIAKLTKTSRGHIDFDEDKNTFHYHGSSDTLALLIDYSRISDSDTIVYKTSYATITIHGDEKQSSLQLISIYRVVPVFREKDYRDKAIQAFEKSVVRKIQRFR